MYWPELGKEIGRPAFLCPICLRAFDHGALGTNGIPQLVDIAHTFPALCGGTLGKATLTCRECNNRIGSELESHVARGFRFHEAPGGHGGKVWGHVEFDGIKIPTTITSSPSGFSLGQHFAHAPPKALERMAQQMQEGEKVTITIRWLHPHKYSAAMLHSAYLTMFRVFGYEYIIAANTEWIRTILTSDPPPEPPIGISMEWPVGRCPPEALFNVRFALLDDRIRVACVFLPNPNNERPVRVMMLPGFLQDGSDQYEELKKTAGTGEIKMDCRWFDMNPEILAVSDEKLFGSRLWE